MDKGLDSTDQVVEEIMGIHRSLPPRPGIDEVEAARALIQNVEKEDHVRLEAIDKQSKNSEVPQELFMVLQEMKKCLVYFHSKELKKEALKLLDLESVHILFDDFIQRASSCISSPPPSNGYAPARPPPSPALVFSADSPTSLNFSGKVPVKSKVLFTRDDSYVKKTKSSLYIDGTESSRKPLILNSTLHSGNVSGNVSGQDGEGEKLSLIKLASLIEVSAKNGIQDLNLQNKLMDQVEWLPDSVGKLSTLITLDLSENHIAVLPRTIGSLSSLKKLDLHSNGIAQLPDSIGNLLNLIYLNLSGNQLSSLPSKLNRLVRLEELDLSSNGLSILPESIGSLKCLKKLDIETNDLEEIPHTIGECSSLKELCADYNKLKALPEAIGKISTLEVLSVRYNNIRQLPTTMSSLDNLKELDLSFNELESVPESLCFATTLMKLNIGNNFADMRSLPRSIGNLENLQEIDISNNQIQVLPDSFRMLTRLCVLRADENPLEVPPRHIIEKGAQAVVQYMTDLVEKGNTKTQTVKEKKSWVQMCFFSKSSKRKRNGMEFV